MRRINLVIVGAAILIFSGIFLFIARSPRKDEGFNNRANVHVLLNRAEDMVIEKDFLEAKKVLAKALESTTDVDAMKEITQKLEKLNLAIIFSPVPDECSEVYEVKPNDSLVKIAKQFNTTVELIKKANSLKSDIIKPKQKLKVNVCAFSIVVDKSQNLLFLKRKGEIIKTYSVSTGKNNSTPAGSFTVVNKLKNPSWFRPGEVVLSDSPENILGTRWIGFNIRGYGIHGTVEPDKIGQQVTLGCVRMRNEDVEELYDLIPRGVEIEIVD